MGRYLGIAMLLALFAGLSFASTGNVLPAPTLASITALAPDTYRVASQQGDAACGVSAAQDTIYQNARLIEVNTGVRQMGRPGDVLTGDYTFSKALIDPVGWVNANGTVYQNMNANASQYQPIVFWKVPGRDCYNWAHTSYFSILAMIKFDAIGYGNLTGEIGLGKDISGFVGSAPTTQTFLRIIEYDPINGGGFILVPMYISSNAIRFSPSSTQGTVYYNNGNGSNFYPHAVPPAFTTNRGIVFASINTTKISLAIPSAYIPQNNGTNGSGSTPIPGTITALAPDTYRVATQMGSDTACGAAASQDWVYQDARLVKMDASPAAVTVDGYNVSGLYFDPIGMTSSGATLNGVQSTTLAAWQYQPKVLYKIPGKDCYNWVPENVPNIFQAIGVNGSAGYIYNTNDNVAGGAQAQILMVERVTATQGKATAIPMYVPAYPNNIAFKASASAQGSVYYTQDGSSNFVQHVIPPTFTTDRGIAFTAVEMGQVAFSLPGDAGSANTTHIVTNITAKPVKIYNGTIANKSITTVPKTCVAADIKCTDTTAVREYTDSRGCKHTCAAIVMPVTIKQACETAETTYVDCSWFARKPTAAWVAGDGCKYACRGSATSTEALNQTTTAADNSTNTTTTGTVKPIEIAPDKVIVPASPAQEEIKPEAIDTKPIPLTNTSISKAASTSKITGALYDESLFNYATLMNILGVYIEGYKQ